MIRTLRLRLFATTLLTLTFALFASQASARSQQVVHGGSSRCVLEEGVVSCEGEMPSPYRWTNVQRIAISANGFHLCGITDFGIECRNLNTGDEPAVGLKPASELVVGSDFACAPIGIAPATTVACFRSTPGSLSPIPTLKNPRGLSLNDRTVCASTDQGQVCWLAITN